METEGTSVALQDLEEFMEEQFELDGGAENHDARHDLSWMMLTVEAVGDISRLSTGDIIDPVPLRNSLISTAATLMCWAETLDRRGAKTGIA